MPIKRPTKKPKAPEPQGNTVAVIEDDLPSAYRSLGGETGFNPLALQRARIWHTAFLKTGSTCLHTQRPNTAYIDVEDAARNFPMAKGSHRFTVHSYRELEAVIKQLELDAAKNKRYFEHVTFDTLDGMVPLIADHLGETVCRKKRTIYEYGGGKGGYKLLNEATAALPRRVYRAGYGWTCIGHLKYRTVKTTEQNEFEAPGPMVSPGIADAISNDADMIWELYKKDRRVKNWKQNGLSGPHVRVVTLRTRSTTSTTYGYEIGTRVPFIDELLIPKHGAWDQIIKAYEEAVDLERRRWENGGPLDGDADNLVDVTQLEFLDDQPQTKKETSNEELEDD